MEKNTAHYSLELIKQLIEDGDYDIANSAFFSIYNELELDDEVAVEVVLSLIETDLYKSMVSKKMLGLWQDVYKKLYKKDDGEIIPLYIKLQIRDDLSVIISFKEDQSA